MEGGSLRDFKLLLQAADGDELHLEDAVRLFPHPMSFTFALCAMSSLCSVPFLNFGCSFLGLKLHCHLGHGCCLRSNDLYYISANRTFKRKIGSDFFSFWLITHEDAISYLKEKLCAFWKKGCIFKWFKFLCCVSICSVSSCFIWLFSRLFNN